MKTNRTIVSMLTATTLLFFVACSGNKKEAEDKQPNDASPAVTSKASDVKVFENVDVTVKSQINGFLEDYFALNQFLIEDNQEGAKAAAKKLSETVNKFDMSMLAGEQMNFYHTQEAKLKAGLNGISLSSDIEETRTELSTVSEAMYALVKAYHPNESALYFQFCPMAKNGDGASWVSNTKEIINPYMGQRMLKCGSTKETL